MRVEFCCEGCERTILGAAASAVVYRRITEHAVEPGNQRFFRNIVEALEVPCKRVLENVFCRLAAAGATLEETEKGPVILDEHVRASCIGYANRRVLVRFCCHFASIGTQGAPTTDARIGVAIHRRAPPDAGVPSALE